VGSQWGQRVDTQVVSLAVLASGAPGSGKMKVGTAVEAPGEGDAGCGAPGAVHPVRARVPGSAGGSVGAGKGGHTVARQLAFEVQWGPGPETKYGKVLATWLQQLDLLGYLLFHVDRIWTSRDIWHPFPGDTKTGP